MATPPTNGDFSATIAGAALKITSSNLVLIIMLLGLFGIIVAQDVTLARQVREHHAHMAVLGDAIKYAFQQLTDMRDDVQTLAQSHYYLDTCRHDVELNAQRLGDRMDVVLMRLPSPPGGGTR